MGESLLGVGQPFLQSELAQARVEQRLEWCASGPPSSSTVPPSISSRSSGLAP